jgi:hypothetical protein
MKNELGLEFSAPIVEEVNGFMVVRDDLLEGGTKMRGFENLFSVVKGSTYVYASPTFGAAQVALAMACHRFKKRAVVFVPKRAKLSVYTKTARDYGADVRLVNMGFLSHCTSQAKAFSEQEDDCVLLPFGIDHPAMMTGIVYAARRIEYQPNEVWSAVSSGTLTRALQIVWPTASFFGVSVGHTPTAAQRGLARVFLADEKFSQRAKHPPPFPSAITYDAKVWQFMKSRAAPGSLFWNVSR